ncbi:glycosyl hydrolase family 47-domain-containing protein [Stachybotrys elegans]|uniref:alpha-1,2-Mannosidase n=1 Tax=Stachybotrys elegans TaxID=80388 RepID=A0A8K0SX62_9HYPO|nr:glycosyl hydrolase family 47-domain-containing protein [Stachybotrys elegans]
MPRRRYRLFMVCAAVILFMLYRVGLNSWDDPTSYTNIHFPGHNAAQPPSQGHQRPLDASPPLSENHDDHHDPEDERPVPNQKPPVEQEPKQPPPAERPPSHEPETNNKPPVALDDATTASQAAQAAEAAAARPKADQVPLAGDDKSDPAPEQVPGTPTQKLPLRPQNPPKEAPGSQPQKEGKKKIHWKKPQENFPLESLTPLPDGRPKQIPKVQYDFPPESAEAKTKRLERQKRVKEELVRSWSGYRKFAWMHDELMPVSGKYKDPFCGWAATLVDSLDTLWIAGMKDEFDEAAKAVADIDFTWSERDQIPVFETTIRYLGGLLAAYDVSGGRDGNYKILLDKAIELAEVLMGIFDTPNRMPLLYYRWAPEFASQPHRAGRVGIAELGTLSMEFTRLSQLTGRNKYYDAVNRITDALVKLQEAGTAIPGLFPENLDASGCNRTATTIRDNLSAAAQRQVDSEELSPEPEGYNPLLKAGSGGVETTTNLRRRDDQPGSQSADSEETTETRVNPEQPPLKANGKSSDWDCVPQDLAVGPYELQAYHMGGAQDSAYEYFPKQYLLLGGLEPKYQKLHEDTVNAVNEWLLYRPMADDDWDVLFPAKVTTSGDPETDLEPIFEITHLTCFIGGMYALGGKIFGREQDVEMAKQLTDGCVWAYQLTPSGIMPEGSEVITCPSLEKCEFNQTLWYERLDPSKDWREKQIEGWEEMQKTLAAESESDPDPAEATAAPGGGATQFQKRGSVEDEEGSELPQSLKDKLTHNNEGSSGSETPGEEVAVKAAAEDDPGVPAAPPKNDHRPTKTSLAMQAKKPQTHEEFVKERLSIENLPPGFVNVRAPNYILRPEAIESVWYMYRITGDPTWMEKGWKMFEATTHATRTEYANSAINNVLTEEPGLNDSMESFWIAETLKYYYLLFSEPDLISLDEWVLNTEAHPFKRPLPAS